MALLGPELARKQVLKYLQDNLNTEIDKIELERNDGLTVPAVDAWFAYERDRSDVDNVRCEVYRQPARAGDTNTVVFPLWDRNMSNRLSASAALNMRCMVEIALSHSNRDNVDAFEMQDRSDRYAAALIRLIRNDPELGYSGSAQISTTILRLVVSERKTGAGDPGAVDISRVDTVTMLLAIELTEDKDSEGVLDGGNPPTVSAETF